MNKKIALEERKSHILQSALACFLEKGFNQTGIRDIAKRAEVSLGNLYNHFASKRMVLIEIAKLEKEELQPFLQQLSQRENIEAVLETFIRTYADYVSDPDDIRLMMEIIGEAIRDDEIAALFTENETLVIDQLAQLLAAGQEQGLFALIDSPQSHSCMILDLIDGLGFRQALAVQSDTPSPVNVDSLIKLIFKSLKP